MKRILLATMVCFSWMVSHSQQDMSLTNFIFNTAGINPGAVGITPNTCGTLIYRNQWDKVLGAPNSVVFNLETNLLKNFKGGAGLLIDHDAIGFNRQTGLQASYAYPISLKDFKSGVGATIGIGASVGIMSFGIKPDWVVPSSSLDPVLPIQYNASKLDVNLGIYFRANDGSIFGGISAKHITQPAFEFINYKSKQYYYISGGYRLPESVLGPGYPEAQMLVRTDFIKATFDLNVRYVLNPVYIGLTYRVSDAYAFMFGLSMNNNTVVGYSYDLNTGQIGNISRGTHEFVLKHCIPLKPVPVMKTKNPIWL